MKPSTMEPRLRMVQDSLQTLLIISSAGVEAVFRSAPPPLPTEVS